MENFGLSQKDAQFKNKWRRRIKGQPANWGLPGKMAVYMMCVYQLFSFTLTANLNKTVRDEMTYLQIFCITAGP